MDSKLISSNIAWFSRYEIIHATLLKEITKDGILQIEDQLIRQQTLEFFDEDAAKTVYQTDSESMNKRLTSLGIIINMSLKTDQLTDEVIIAIPTKADKWKIQLQKDDDTTVWRYFDRNRIEKAKTRREVDSIPFEQRKKRNNVEATIFQYCFHTRNNKTRYRGLMKHTLQALARCAWINLRRLFLFDLELQLQRT